MALGFASGGLLKAAGPTDQVGYSLTNNPPSIFDAVPAETPTSYVIGVTAPGAFSAATPLVPAFSIEVTTGPANAASYLTIIPDPLHPGQPVGFTTAGQTLYFRITGKFPLVTVSTTYAYTVRAEGWPFAVTNVGHHITATSVPPTNPVSAPTVTIVNPLNGAVLAPSLPANLSLSFVASATAAAPVSTVSATLTGPGMPGVPLTVSPSGMLNLASVEASASMAITRSGTYTVEVQAANAVGLATARATFTVNFVGTRPTVELNNPSSGSAFPRILTSPTVVVPLQITGRSTTTGAVVRALAATLKAPGAADTALTFTTSGLDVSGVATGQAHLSLVAGGEYTIVATSTDDFGTSTAAETKFTVVLVKAGQSISFGPIGTKVFGDAPSNLGGAATSGLPVTYTSSDPTVATVSGKTLTILRAGSTIITAQQAGDATYNAAPAVQQTLTVNKAEQTIIFPMIGDPFVDAGNLTLTAFSGSGLPITYASSNPGVATVSGNTLTVVGLGMTSITASQNGNDNYLPASTVSQLLNVRTRQLTLAGVVFLDSNGDGSPAGETGAADVLVHLLGPGANATTRTAPDGSYSFPATAGTSYSVVVSVPSGATASPTNTHSLPNLSASVTNLQTGLRLDLDGIRAMSASGYTIGFWKNNIEKTLEGRGGVQVSGDLGAYTASIRNFGLAPFSNLTLAPAAIGVAESALDILGSTSSLPGDLLRKQLLGSEYNLANGAFINGDEGLTRLFILWGETVLMRAATANPADVVYAKDWFEAYNASHGGPVRGPKR